jgi:ubiquinone/menaquinone biosynthesis C-methylase UbiE
MTINTRLTEITRNRYQRHAGWYDMMAPFQEKKFLPWRIRMWKLAVGPKILEVGVGAGRNLPLISRNFEVTGIDLTPGMLEKAIQRSSELGLKIDLRIGDVQRLAFDDASFDTVVATCVFCSVPDPIQGFREIKRVLKPGGRLYLLEHMRSPNPVIGRIMDFLNPLVVRMMGANINRKTMENIRSAGMEILESEDLDRSGIFKFIIASGSSMTF